MSEPGYCILLAMVAAFAGAQAGAQTVTQTEGLPIAVDARPRSARVGSPVTIDGQTVVFGSDPFVTVSVRPPTGPPRTLRSAVTTTGFFSVVFGQTDETGIYEVQAVASDHKGAAHTSFSVVTPGTIDESVGQLARAALQTATRHTARLGAMVDGLPLSPPKPEVQRRIAALRRAMDQAAPQLDDLPELLDQVSRARTSITDARQRARFDRVVQELDKYADAARTETPKLDDQLSAYTHDNLVCDQLDHMTEGFKLLSALLDFVGNPFSILLNFAKDLDADAASSQFSNPYAQLAVSTLVKNINSAIDTPARDAAGNQIVTRPQQVLSGLPTFAADLSAFVSEQVFSSYCLRFVGPVEGTMHAKFYRGGKVWWEYSFEIQGRVVLRYPKDTPAGTPIRLSGQMEGLGTNFQVSEEALGVLHPELSQASIAFHTVTLPWFSSAVSGALLANAIKEGSAFAAQAPNAFFFPVEGDLLNDKMTLRLGAKQIDFEDKTADALYLVASPLSLLHPVVGFALPFKGARFAIGRALNDGPAHLDVKIVNGVLTVEQQYDRRRDSGESHGRYTFRLKACNPGC